MRLFFLVCSILFHHAALRAQTFSSTVNMAIPDDGSTVFFEIQVSGLPDAIDTLFGLEQVCLNLNHTYNADMTVKLEAPNGQEIVLFAGVGGGEDNFINTCVAGEGLAWNTHSAPFTGTFQSYGVLGNFNKGQNPNGTWKLVVHDTYAFADEGYLIDWDITFGNNPAKPFVFYSSDLPIVKLTTLEEDIADDPKVPVLMQIIDNGVGLRNYPDQAIYAYEGKIMAEWQGFTGPYYPKKNYDFELVDSLGNELDSTILGMPRESDWILKAEYLDLTLLKNTTTYEMARRMGGYAPRTAPCELVLDGEYLGIYFLTEKIKRDKNRIDIAKLTPSDTSGIELTGGYIFEMNINGDPADWVSEYLPINFATCQSNVEFKHVYPKNTDILPQQAEYIRNYTSDFENILQGDDFKDPNSGYRKWVDVNTFVDFMLVNEFSINYDSYGRSTYLYKEKETDGGLLKIGPPWDYDRAMDYFTPDLLELWVWKRTHDYWPFPFWWSRMWEDPSFRHQAACRWQNLRENTLSTPAFTTFIDSMAYRLAEAQTRNFRIWNDLGALTHEGHVTEMKSYLTRRLHWMDSTLTLERPSASFLTDHNGLTLFLAPEDTTAQSYLWDFGDGSTSVLKNPSHAYANSGTYTVRLTVGYGQGCSVSAEKSIVLTPLGATEDFGLQEKIYPNPFKDHIFVKNSTGLEQFELFNAIGQTVFSGKNIAREDFSKLPKGVYFLKMGKEKASLIKI